MHNSLLPEVIEVIRQLDNGEIIWYKNIYYLKIPKDMFSPLRDCVIVLERYEDGWRISDDKNTQLLD